MFNKKMDYYKEFTEGAKERTKVFITQRDGLVKTIKQARKNLSNEQEAGQKLRERIDTLNSLSSVSLTDDDLSFQKYKTSLKKLTTELETSDSMCLTLQNKVIPQKESELLTAEANLKNTLRAYLMECKPVADKEIQKLLEVCTQERESFVSAFRAIYQDAGEVLIVNNESLLPGAWLAREVLVPSPISLTPEITPVAEKTPAAIPLKGSSQAVEAVGASENE